MYDTPITLKEEKIKPSKFIRLLGAYLDRELTYKAYFKALNTKIPKLLSAIKSIAVST